MRSRLTPFNLFKHIWPDREDPENPGQYLCRFCGKPTTDTRRRYWCSDHCYDMTQKSISWTWVRREVYMRDQGRCQHPGCGKQLKLYVGDDGPGEEIAECHHIKSVKEFRRTAWDLTSEWGLEGQIGNRAFAIIYTLLFLDSNNLISLCQEHHKLNHAADNRNQVWAPPFQVARTHWANFWEWAEREHYTRRITDFF